MILLVSFGFQVRAEERDSVVVSLLTCWPGPEIYELCGHEAIRTRCIRDGIEQDTVWNYGVFDFNEPGFVYRYVKGETDYMLGAYPFAMFMPEYRATGRKVVEQRLNLTQDEARKLLGMLREESRPENRRYRYNYVKDNCATRIVERLDSATTGRVIYPDSVNYGSYRNAMRRYHKNYPWYQFGIDLALGSGIDVPTTGREEMFVPMEMMRKVAGAHLSDGRQLVAETYVLNEGIPSAILNPTPWYLTPLFWSWIAFLICVFAAVLILVKGIEMKFLYSIWFGICGLAGILVTFLVFISEHEATSPNLLVTWLNPLQLLIAICIWIPSMRICVKVMSWINILWLSILLIIWPAQTQSANPAFFPLMAGTLLLSACYLLHSGKRKAAEKYRQSSGNYKKSSTGTGKNNKKGGKGKGK